MSITKECVLPGDDLTEYIGQKSEDDKNPKILGSGLYRDLEKKTIIATNGGQLFQRKMNTYNCILSHQRYYLPVKGDYVIGVVVSGSYDDCRLDIGTKEYVTLSLFNFVGATKKNKPNINIGDLVYAQISGTEIDCGTTLTCVRDRVLKWGLGILPSGGYMVKVPVSICRLLLQENNKVTKILGSKYAFETAIGLNGRIWIHAPDTSVTIKISNIFKKLEYIPIDQHEVYLKEHV